MAQSHHESWFCGRGELGSKLTISSGGIFMKASHILCTLWQASSFAQLLRLGPGQLAWGIQSWQPWSMPLESIKHIYCELVNLKLIWICFLCGGEHFPQCTNLTAIDKIPLEWLYSNPCAVRQGANCQKSLHSRPQRISPGGESYTWQNPQALDFLSALQGKDNIPADHRTLENLLNWNLVTQNPKVL